MQVHEPLKKFTIAIFIILALNGCVTSPEQSTSQERDIKNGLVVRDLLYSMSQIFPPHKTTLQIGKPSTAFGQELENGFREVGYGMQRVEADQGPMFMTYGVASQSRSGGRSTSTYNVFIGDVGLERLYVDVEGGGIAPAGPMKVFGTDKEIELNEELFPGQSLEVTYETDSEVKFDAAAITVIDDEVMKAISKLKTQNIPSYKSLNSQNQEIENLFRRGTSNFEGIETKYRVVRKEIIVFPNDSLLLLDKGRAQIEKVVRYYRKESDVIRLVGCSNGPTEFEGGNESLALGRSERVAKELISRNIAQEAILDEGCWAGQSSDKYPARGVVMELQRKNN